MAPKLLLPMCSSCVPLFVLGPCRVAQVWGGWVEAARVTGEHHARGGIYAISAGQSMDAAIMSHPGGSYVGRGWRARQTCLNCRSRPVRGTGACPGPGN